MPGTFFVGDLHFNHLKVAQIRGFETVTEHDMHLILKWQKQVHPDDTVWVLGDISSGRPEGEAYALNVMSQLPGHKHLIAGNHDSVSSIHRNGYKKQAAWLKVFESIQQFGRIRVEGEDVLMSHYPYAHAGDGPGRGGNGRYLEYRLPYEFKRLIHAHTHHTHPTNASWTNDEICVSWDAWRRLVNYGDIAKWVLDTRSNGV